MVRIAGLVAGVGLGALTLLEMTALFQAAMVSLRAAMGM